MPKVTVNLPRPVYNHLSKLVEGGKSFDEVLTSATAILIDTIHRESNRELETAHWFNIASSIDMDYRKTLIAFLDNGIDLFVSLYKRHQSKGDLREQAQTLRVIILLEYLKECINNEDIDYLMELRYPPIEEELEYWQQRGFKIPEALRNTDKHDNVVGIRLVVQPCIGEEKR
ncbi:hypothetical protein [Caldicellulosiruptor acetigenus]|uniref:hypothetical protein n=1 Tax=Caldicellulosiruptor acetigenus TaxID=301953 RepID=UPI0004270A6D|nr:hypothetical protein [Caldicellulosiruptor acetigenus]WAM35601.1 hypothetical protein OTK01_001951 [Caldicellulosiruptor acetigenus]